MQTVDFFTPIVDDPFTYGQIAATNSLSDCYAMGGRPLTALAIVGMPAEVIGHEVINEILRGGAAKAKEARCALAGGHSIKNPEPIYGLSVTGLVHPERIITNAAASPGDLLVLTKPLGTGILTTAIKRELIKGAVVDKAIGLMTTLNTPGATLAEKGLVKAGTDITGFGLLGHLKSLCLASGVRAELRSGDIPVIDPEVMRLITEESCVPGGSRENLEGVGAFVDWSEGVDEATRLLLADAQTSGGLLLCVAEKNLDEVLELLDQAETLSRAVIGRILPPDESDARVISVR